MQTLIHDFKQGPIADRDRDYGLKRAKTGTLETLLLVGATTFGVVAGILADQLFNLFA